jgi:hypothetical protein
MLSERAKRERARASAREPDRAEEMARLDELERQRLANTEQIVAPPAADQIDTAETERSCTEPVEREIDEREDDGEAPRPRRKKEPAVA